MEDRPGLCLRFAPGLRVLMTSRRRAAEVRVAVDGTSSLGHLVESLGVPLPEVGELRLLAGGDGPGPGPGSDPGPGADSSSASGRDPGRDSGSSSGRASVPGPDHRSPIASASDQAPSQDPGSASSPAPGTAAPSGTAARPATAGPETAARPEPGGATGRPVGASYRPRDGDVVEVLAVRRPEPLPDGGPPRFLLDVHLGGLARRMRLLGLDTAYRNDADDPLLVEIANAERRLLLTQDRGLLRRRALWRGAFVRGARPDEQLTDVLSRFAPPLAPWSRCLSCNGTLVDVPKADIEHALRPGTRRSYDTFTRCPDCGRVYWPGAHRERLDAVVAEAERAAGY